MEPVKPLPSETKTPAEHKEQVSFGGTSMDASHIDSRPENIKAAMEHHKATGNPPSIAVDRNKKQTAPVASSAPDAGAQQADQPSVPANTK